MNQNEFPPPSSHQNPNPKETAAPSTNPIYPDLNTKARVTGIYYCPFPRALARPGHAVWYRAAYAVGFIFVTFIIIHLSRSSPAAPIGLPIWTIPLLIISWLSATVGTIINWNEENNLLNWTPLADKNTPTATRCYRICRTVFQQRFPAGPLRKLDPRVAALLRRATKNQTQTIADDQYQSKLAAIKISGHLRDPDHVESGFSFPPIVVGLNLLPMPFFLYFAWSDSNWILVALMLPMWCLMIYSIRPIRARIRNYINFNPYRPIIGPGVIIDHKNHRWTVNDSIMLINHGHMGIITITVISPTKILRFVYKKFDDPDFINLWQNWNHPNPRPELLT